MSNLGDLSGRLRELRPAKVRELAKFLDAAGQNETVDAARATLRHQMVVLRPLRRATPQRLFCDPFEDLLVAGAPPPGRISRAAMNDLWRRVAAGIGKAGLSDIQDKIDRYEAGDAEVSSRVGPKLWAQAIDILRRSDPAGLSADSAACVDLVLDSLAAADHIRALKIGLPGKPMDGLTEEETQTIWQTLIVARALGPGPAAAAALTTAFRFARPAAMLTLLQDGAAPMAAMDRKELARRVGGAISGTLAARAETLDRAPPARAVVEVGRMLDEWEGLAATGSRDPVAAEAARAKMAAVVEAAILAPAAQRIEAAPILADASDEASEEALALLRKAQGPAARLGVADAAKVRIAAVVERIETEAKELIAGGKADAAWRGQANQLVRACEVLRGSGPAYALSQRLGL